MYCASPRAADGDGDGDGNGDGDGDGDGAADAPLVQLCYAEVAFAYHVPPTLAPAAATPAIGDARKPRPASD